MNNNKKKQKKRKRERWPMSFSPMSVFCFCFLKLNGKIDNNDSPREALQNNRQLLRVDQCQYQSRPICQLHDSFKRQTHDNNNLNNVVVLFNRDREMKNDPSILVCKTYQEFNFGIQFRTQLPITLSSLGPLFRNKIYSSS